MYSELPTAEVVDFKTQNSWQSLIVTHSTPRRFDKTGDYCRQGFLVTCEPSVPEELASREEIEDGIWDAFRQRCYCSHDCCGHVNTSVHNIRPLSGNRFLVVVTGCRNV